MKYKEAIKKSMEDLALDPRVIFLGYNTLFGSKAYGTFFDIPPEKILETPLAENLMVGLSIGMSLEGLLPVVFFERHDFLLNASDAIINHAGKIERLSHNQFRLPMIIRAIVGSNKPINPGPTHLQDFTEAFKSMVKFPIYEPKSSQEVLDVYASLKNTQSPAMVVERKELYNMVI